MQDLNTRQYRTAEKLRELASWYREFAERAGSAVIREARLRIADDLEVESGRFIWPGRSQPNSEDPRVSRRRASVAGSP